jgi:hypothetical protein
MIQIQTLSTTPGGIGDILTGPLAELEWLNPCTVTRRRPFFSGTPVMFPRTSL